jgi:hypothetical protein
MERMAIGMKRTLHEGADPQISALGFQTTAANSPIGVLCRSDTALFTGGAKNI